MATSRPSRVSRPAVHLGHAAVAERLAELVALREQSGGRHQLAGPGAGPGGRSVGASRHRAFSSQLTVTTLPLATAPDGVTVMTRQFAGFAGARPRVVSTFVRNAHRPYLGGDGRSTTPGERAGDDLRPCSLAGRRRGWGRRRHRRRDGAPRHGRSALLTTTCPTTRAAAVSNGEQGQQHRPGRRCRIGLPAGRRRRRPDGRRRLGVGRRGRRARSRVAAAPSRRHRPSRLASRRPCRPSAAGCRGRPSGAGAGSPGAHRGRGVGELRRRSA